MYAKQSTAKTFLVGPILDADGAAKTDEVIGSIKVSKNGTVGAADAQDTLTHDHTGHYVLVSDGGDFDTLGEVEFSLNSTTNAMAPVKFQVLPANVYDSLVGGTDTLQVEATSHTPTQEIRIGLPHVHYFVPNGTPSTYSLIGPDHEISKASAMTAAVADTTNGGYLLTITPDEIGAWMLIVKNAAGAVVHAAQWECVRATQAEHSLGLQNNQDSLVVSYPTKAIAESPVYSNITSSGAAYSARCFVSKGKLVCPMDGYIYGLDFYTNSSVNAGLASVNSLKFFTCAPTGIVRGISNDFKAVVSGSGFVRVVFTKPVLARAGDWYGLEVKDTSGSNNYCLMLVTVSTNTANANEIEIKNSALAIDGSANTFVNWDVGVTNLTLALKLLYHPPAIAIAGHSIMASHPGSHTIYEDTLASAYSRADDLAAILGDILGVSCVNCADGGTSIGNWVGATGLFETIVTPLHPSIVIFDTVLNDTSYTSEQYWEYLDRLNAHADQQGIELILREAECPAYATANSLDDDVERLNAVTRRWCEVHGKTYIPTYYRLGEATDAVGNNVLRRQQKDLTDIDDYGQAGANPDHLSTAGIKAMAVAIAEAIRRRTGTTWNQAWYSGANLTTLDDEVPLTRAQMQQEATDAITAASLATATNLADVAGYLDTEIADIKAKTDLIPASPAAVGSAMTLTPAYDAAKTAASSAEVTAATSPLATAVEVAKIPKDGETHTYTNTGTGAAATVTIAGAD